MIPRVPRIFRIALSLLAVLLLAGACSKFQTDKDSAPVPGQPIPHPTIVFMTDFGTANDAVAICKAVILGIRPEDIEISKFTRKDNPPEAAANFPAIVDIVEPMGAETNLYLHLFSGGRSGSRYFAQSHRRQNQKRPILHSSR